MTYAFDIERVRVACAEAERAAADLARHPLADWLAHRVEHLRGELKDFVNATNTQTTQTTQTAKEKENA
jgi:hypothetical protein